ncbi:MAG: transposase [Porticoccaceae bacterium]|nr:transposase [Porticoccaceae bacterium]
MLRFHSLPPEYDVTTRLPRFVIPGYLPHVIQRGNNGEAIFYTESDYQFYLEKLSEVATKYECELHAYVLTTNHVHLLVTPQQNHSIGKMIQSVGRY